VPTRIEIAGRLRATIIAGLLLAMAGCSADPTDRERKNRRELEALLTAITLKDREQLDRDAERIEARHASGELSAAPYKAIGVVVEKARSGDWAGAERDAYRFREESPFFN
jgi:hypothetical protein